MIGKFVMIAAGVCLLAAASVIWQRPSVAPHSGALDTFLKLSESTGFAKITHRAAGECIFAAEVSKTVNDALIQIVGDVMPQIAYRLIHHDTYGKNQFRSALLRSFSNRLDGLTSDQKLTVIGNLELFASKEDNIVCVAKHAIDEFNS